MLIMGLGGGVGRILSLAQDCGDEQSFLAAALAELARAVSLDSALLALSPGDPRPAEINKREFLPLMKLMVNHPERYLPGLAKGRDAAARFGAYLDSEVYSSVERRELAFFRDILGPQRVTSQIVASVRFRGQQTALLHLCRHDRGKPFSRDDLELIRQVLPLLALGQAAHRAYDLHPPEVPSEEPRDRLESLTPREQEIVRYLCRGLRNREIATVLGSSPNTVRNQLTKVFAKLGVESRTELVALLVNRD
jgi:DNA-binding CsgD family transcriptional regulator